MRDLMTAECAEVSGGFVFVIPLREARSMTPEESLAFQMGMGALIGLAGGVVAGAHSAVGPELGMGLGALIGFFGFPLVVKGVYGGASYGFDLVKPLYL